MSWYGYLSYLPSEDPREDDAPPCYSCGDYENCPKASDEYVNCPVSEEGRESA